MIYTEKEKQELWERSQVAYAEKAHEFPCCKVPTLTSCILCVFGEDECDNKKEVAEVLG